MLVDALPRLYCLVKSVAAKADLVYVRVNYLNNSLFRHELAMAEKKIFELESKDSFATATWSGPNRIRTGDLRLVRAPS